MKWSSLRIRFGLYYAMFTLACLTIFGVFLTLYLKNALEESRLPAMIRRTERLTDFVNRDHRGNPTITLAQSLASYLKAAPENDEVVVRSSDGKTLLFAAGGEPSLENIPGCRQPCYREITFRGHRLRTYEVPTVLDGIPVQLMLAGLIDENAGILSTVGNSYLIFVPFLLLASITGGYLFSGRALAPVGRMTSMASRLSISDLRGRVPVPTTGDELQNLAEAWNSMLSRLQVSVERNVQFSSDASHDLRTSISVILTSAQLALSRVRTPEEHTKLLKTVVKECEHTLTLLEDLLVTARFGFEHHELQQNPLELADVVRESCLLFHHQAEAKEQSITLDLAPQLWILGDRSLLHRLIAVLVENAVKYTPRGGAISVKLRDGRTQVLLEVCDTGPGIASEDLPHIFDRHFRSQMSRQSERGNGLGLNIARWIAEAHRASIAVLSTGEQGSVFQVEFPSLQAAPRQAS